MQTIHNREKDLTFLPSLLHPPVVWTVRDRTESVLDFLKECGEDEEQKASLSIVNPDLLQPFSLDWRIQYL